MRQPEGKTMPARALNFRRILILSAGWLFIALGVVGLFLPFLQGILFLMIGFYLLSRESVWARRLRQWLRTRYPRLATRLDETEIWVEQRWNRLRRRGNERV
jgi:hypothetical protein